MKADVGDALLTTVYPALSTELGTQRTVCSVWESSLDCIYCMETVPNARLGTTDIEWPDPRLLPLESPSQGGIEISKGK